MLPKYIPYFNLGCKFDEFLFKLKLEFEFIKKFNCNIQFESFIFNFASSSLCSSLAKKSVFIEFEFAALVENKTKNMKP